MQTVRHWSRQSRPRRSGFTLLEVLLVLAILGVIAAMVVPNLLGRQDEAYRKTTRASIKGFEDAVMLYAAEHDGLFPEGDENSVVNTLRSPEADQQTGKQRAAYLDKPPLDAWKHMIHYEYPATGNRGTPSGKPAIWSDGPRLDDTNDDINNWAQ